MKNSNRIFSNATRYDVSCGPLEFSAYGTILESRPRLAKQYFAPPAVSIRTPGNRMPMLRKIAHNLGSFLLAL